MVDEKKGERPESRWSRLWRENHKWYLLWIPVGGILMFAAGIVFWGGFNTVLEATNTEAFCISCHEMHDFVYQEYKETAITRTPRAFVRPVPTATFRGRGFTRLFARSRLRTSCTTK